MVGEQQPERHTTASLASVDIGQQDSHAEPTALVATPLFIIVIASLAIWKLLSLACPTGSAALLVFGLYAGYNYFALFHHWEAERVGASQLVPAHRAV